MALDFVGGRCNLPTVMENEEHIPEDKFLKGLREQFPDIRPYGEDDWDWTWGDEGLEFLEAGDMGMAELRFQQLIAAQPESPDGYEGLALVYKQIRRKREAGILIDEAIRIAGILVEKGHTDSEVLDEMLLEQAEIRAM
jgi:tetratricopeptide (TPR) repeat protein